MPSSPPVRVSCRIINEKTKEVVRYAGLEFHAENTDFEGKPRRTINSRIETETAESDAGKHYLHLNYTNRVVFGTDNIPDTWPASIKDELKSLASYQRSGLVKLEMPYNPTESKDNAQKLLAYLNNRQPNSFLAPLKYQSFDGTSKPQKFLTSWDELTWAYGKGRKLSVVKGQSILPAVYCFGSPEEAKLRLTVADNDFSHLSIGD